MNIKDKIYRFLHKTDIEYQELINSKEYFESVYRIRYDDANDGYVLYDTITKQYVDLVSNYHQWKYNSTYYRDCLVDSKKKIIDAYNRHKKNMHIYKNKDMLLSDYKKLDEINIHTIEQYLRSKKLKKL